ncbi:hypothetical protein MARPO_0103s0060 [Marchantia polymorpha]|uniref:Uncharacterized protein n=1 Tax=Marchantia polymorpha TaxID=3197 RepID=A0A2R6WE15_MARPO|nr:hypothetical protein MARPO_0103s0060 [Marchantia polymorpha]|eukprot:PTQ32092.1 hypothetical protein MARPO_0103s0060 [Marchantia polymorpha]
MHRGSRGRGRRAGERKREGLGLWGGGEGLTAPEHRVNLCLWAKASHGMACQYCERMRKRGGERRTPAVRTNCSNWSERKRAEKSGEGKAHGGMTGTGSQVGRGEGEEGPRGAESSPRISCSQPVTFPEQRHQGNAATETRNTGAGTGSRQQQQRPAAAGLLIIIIRREREREKEREGGGGVEEQEEAREEKRRERKEEEERKEKERRGERQEVEEEEEEEEVVVVVVVVEVEAI